LLLAARCSVMLSIVSAVSEHSWCIFFVASVVVRSLTSWRRKVDVFDWNPNLEVRRVCQSVENT
jgi:hypothetical protein